MTTADAKRELRRQLLAARRAADHQDQDQLVRLTLRAWLASRQVTTVAAYAPMAGEPGGGALPETLAEVVPTVLLPVVLPDRDLDWAIYRGPEDLAPAALGLREPTGARLGPDAVSEAEVVLAPALAVDRTGARLGRGGGSYDRALARVHRPQLVIALLYPGELVDRLPAEMHDRPVDGAVIDGTVILISHGD